LWVFCQANYKGYRKMSAVLIDFKAAASGDENPDYVPSIDFDAFWRAYPRKVARKDAEKAWLSVKPDDRPKIIAAIARAKKCDDWRRDGGRYIPYAGTYLRGERWNDEFDVEVDLTMGQCCWNQHGTRENGPRCALPATKEKNGVVYCAAHAGRVN
jgi:hypothetical protein